VRRRGVGRFPFSGAAALLNNEDCMEAGTIVIDTTVPLAATVWGAATRVLSVARIAAEQTRELLPQREFLAGGVFQNPWRGNAFGR